MSQVEAKKTMASINKSGICHEENGDVPSGNPMISPVLPHLVGGFKHVLSSIICDNPSHGLIFSRWLKPPTSHYIYRIPPCVKIIKSPSFLVKTMIVAYKPPGSSRGY